MTHLAFQRANIGLAWFTPSFSGVPAAGDYFTLTVGGVNNLSITGSGTSTLSFPAGTYHFKASIGGNRSSASASNTDFIYYQIEVGGVLVGNLSGWDRYENSSLQRISSNVAEAVFTLSATTNVRVKCTAATGSTFTLDADYSFAMAKGER